MMFDLETVQSVSLHINRFDEKLTASLTLEFKTLEDAKAAVTMIFQDADATKK